MALFPFKLMVGKSRLSLDHNGGKLRPFLHHVAVELWVFFKICSCNRYRLFLWVQGLAISDKMFNTTQGKLFAISVSKIFHISGIEPSATGH